jgi:hypothetical protein
MKTLLVAMVAVGFAGTAAAQLNINEMASGVAIPYVTEEDGLSMQMVVTNTASGSRRLHFDLINGDPGENCESQSWYCTLTARETVQISVVNNTAGGSIVNFECDEVEGLAGPPYAGNDGLILTDSERGVLWVTVEDALGTTVSENVLFADWTAVDIGNAVAVSAPAAGFQGVTNDGDKDYQFDGIEYANFPDSLATNYLPPTQYPGTLLVFTLDLTPGFPAPVRANVLWYDDDEVFEDDRFTFECFDLIDYWEIAPGLGALWTAGHMEMVPAVTQYAPPHGDFSRRVPFLCYNIQEAPGGGMTARACAQSVARFVPLPGDTGPHLDTGF